MQVSATDYRPFGRTADIELRCAESAAARGTLLDFIQRQFRCCYAAEVDDDAPMLVGGYDGSGGLVAAFALRDSATGFFCERYLDAPLVDALSASLGVHIRPEQVVEVAHLCATRPGFLCETMPAAAAALVDRGYRCVACTATARLAGFFRRKGLASVVLGAASPHRLAPEERARWGSYYETRPTVIAGTLDGVPERLRERELRKGGTA